MSGGQNRKPASTLESRFLVILRFFTTLWNVSSAADSAASRDASVLGLWVVAACTWLIVGLLYLGRFLGSFLDSPSFMNAFMLFFTAFLAISFIAGMTLVYELTNWFDAVRFERREARRREKYAEYLRLRPVPPSPQVLRDRTIMPAISDEELADLENYSIQMRDEAFHEAARIAQILNRIHEEIFNERQG